MSVSEAQHIERFVYNCTQQDAEMQEHVHHPRLMFRMSSPCESLHSTARRLRRQAEDEIVIFKASTDYKPFASRMSSNPIKKYD